MNKKIFLALKIFITTGILGFIFIRLDLNKLILNIRDINFYYISLSVCMFLFNGILLRSIKWKYLLDTVELKLEYYFLLQLHWISLFFNQFLPGRTGGDVVKAYAIAKFENSKKYQGVASILVDRISNLIGFLIIGTIAAVIKFSDLPKDSFFYLIILDVVCLSGIIVGYFININTLKEIVVKKKNNWVDKTLTVVEECILLFKKKKVLPITILISVLLQLLLIINVFLISLSIGLDIPIYYFFVYIPIIALLTMLPISVSGFGLREGAYLLFFSGLAPDEKILLIPFIMYLLMLIISSFWRSLLFIE